jgi:hypothetical protein
VGKTKTNVYGLGGIVATQNATYATGVTVKWEHQDPKGESYIETAGNGGMYYGASFNAELDPLGSNVGLTSPTATTPDNAAGPGTRWGDPFGGYSCRMDGFEVPCSHVAHALSAGYGGLDPTFDNYYAGQVGIRPIWETRDIEVDRSKDSNSGVMTVYTDIENYISGYQVWGYGWGMPNQPENVSTKDDSLDEIYKTQPCDVAGFNQLSGAQRRLYGAQAFFYNHLAQLQKAVFVNISGALISAGADLTGLVLDEIEDDRLLFAAGSTDNFQKSIEALTKTKPETFNEAGFFEYQYNRKFSNAHQGMTDYMVRQSVEFNSVQVGFGKKGAFADLDLFNPDKSKKHRQEVSYNSKNKVKTPHFYLANVFGNCNRNGLFNSIRSTFRF